MCVCSHRVEHDVVQTANSQHAVLRSVVVVQEEGGGEQAGQVRGERGPSDLHKTHTHIHTVAVETSICSFVDSFIIIHDDIIAK